jgi:CMP-N,N'-diacetyllegionaminic acid synthase
MISPYLRDTLCVIPARAGSRGIPHKNMQPMKGLPLVAWSIRLAINSGLPHSNIIVSSDDPDVLCLAKDFGVVPHRRPDEFCGENSPSELALIDALPRGENCKAVMMLQPTSPIRIFGRIHDALKTYWEGGYDSLISTTKLYNFMWYQDGEDWWSSYDPQHRPMRQDLPSKDILYFDNGNIYITSKKLLQETQCRVGGKVCVYPITGAEGMQVDTWEDFMIIESMIDSGILLVDVGDLKSQPRSL